ncbi:hypothetical protein Clacol_005994 [Clathrus columnatus]|uniref:Glycoside hydrolase family 5 protein n=1 Tax=Clathrus columnatus TaxID=1419009 RepID=A0AAV5AFL4_9AGAM|nr:hypothetical protein Clacol_005994 [Clathrus columnatus]
MLPSLSISTATTSPKPSPHPYLLHTARSSFKDSNNRTIILRGVNLGGSSKLPYGRSSHETEGFWEDVEDEDDEDGQNVSYIGRPFSLWDPDSSNGEVEDGLKKERREGWYTSNWNESADCHLTRLRDWGFNLIRYVVTWEALEHAGPGKYDYEFIEYTIEVLKKCKEYGFRVYIDPHQDIWSRFSGGSGAPYWTLKACGLNPRNFSQTATAILHHEYPNTESPDPASLPAMLWSTGYGRLVAQTMFTLFWGGKTYAPKCIIDDMNIQDWLQQHYIDAFGILADKILEAGGLVDECIIGWDSLNEPFAGYCALADLENGSTSHGASLKKGIQPTIIQNLCLGMGMKQVVEHWDFGSFGPKRDGEVEIDPKGVKAWMTLEEADEVGGVSTKWGWKRHADWELGTCVWALHGVWSPETSQFLNPAYFSSPTSSFLQDFWLPHFKTFVSRIRSSHPNCILFVQPPVFEPPPPIDESILQGRACLSTHYYDGLTLVTRHWNWFNADALGVIRGKYRWTWQAVKIGSSAIRKSLQDQLSILKSDATLISSCPRYPTVIGEIGTPMDMDSKRSYGTPYSDPKDGDKYKNDYSNQVKALDASLNALDGDNGLSAAIWSYAPGNDHLWGDGWNLEDLSIWCKEEEEKKEEEEVETMVEEEGGNGTMMGSSSANLLLDEQGRVEVRIMPPTPSSSCKRRMRKMTPSPSPSPSPLNMSSTTSLALDDGSVPIPPNPFATTTSLPILSVKPHPTVDNNNLTNITSTATTKPTPPLLTTPSSRLKFLTSGARALEAFCRPYPIATVGKPSNVSFDVDQGVFKMTVYASANDRDGRDQVVPTEIFVPLVQFASEDVWRESSGGGRRKSGDGAAKVTKTTAAGEGDGSGSTSSGSITPAMTPLPSSYHYPPPRINMDDSIPPTPQSIISTAATLASLSPILPTTNTSSATASSSKNEQLPSPMNLIIECTADTSVEVDMDRQVVKWYYDLPPRPSDDDDEMVVVEYQIVIRRGKGKVKSGVRVVEIGKKVADGDEEKVGQSMEEEDDDDERTPTCWDYIERCCNWRAWLGW